MTALPSALACQASRPSRSDLPRDWTAKSTIVVVPPKAAARVPVSKVSLANVPPNGSSIWVWTSIAPGSTYRPEASIVSSAVIAAPARSEPIAAIVSPSTSTSASWDPEAPTIVPLVIRVRIRLSSGPARRQIAQDRDDLSAVGFQDRFLVAIHQVDVELVNAGRGQLAQLGQVVGHRAEHAEPI